MNPYGELFDVAATLPKNDPLLQEKTLQVAEIVYPILDEYGKRLSRESFGEPISIRFLMPYLARDLWRSVVVGESLAAREKRDWPDRFNWRRHRTELIASALSMPEQSVPSKAAVNPKKGGAIVNFAEKIIGQAREVDHPIQIIRDEIFWKMQKLNTSQRDPAHLHALCWNPSTDIKRVIGAGHRMNHWVIHKLSALKSNTANEETPASLVEEIYQKLADLSLQDLTRKMLADGVRHFVNRRLIPYIPLTGAALQSLQEFKSIGPSFFVAHPDYSPNYLAYQTAAHQLRIPSIEIQHGVNMIRLNDIQSLLWRNLPDHYFTYGEFTDFERSNIPDRGRVTHLLGKSVRYHPGTCVRSGYFKRPRRQRPKIKRVLFGSYYTSDLDECEIAVPDQLLIKHEVKVLQQLTELPSRQIILKMRPSSDGGLSAFVPEDILKKLRIEGANQKAGHAFVKKFDLIFVCYYSSMLIESISLGIPTLFFPTEAEIPLLPPDLLNTIQASKKTIRMIRSVDEIPEAIAFFDSSRLETEEPISRKYGRYASPEAKKQLIRDIELTVRTDTAQ